MTGIDWVLLAIVALSALLGLMRGFVGVVLSLLSWLLAGAAAYFFGGDAAAMLSGDGRPSAGYLVGGYVLSFGAVMVFVMLLSWFVRRVLASVGLSGVDRGLGLVLGLLRGALFASVLVLLMGFTSLPAGPDWRRSQVVPVFEPGARWLRSLLPAGIAQEVDFEAGGPISKQALRTREHSLKPLMERGVSATGPGEALRSLGEQNIPAPHEAAELLRSLPDAWPGRPGDTRAAAGAVTAVDRTPERDPANVDGASLPDPVAVDGPASSRPQGR